MKAVFFDFIDQFMEVYIEDILIFITKEAEKLQHLQLVLQRLKEHQLYIGQLKCQFMKDNVEFLGLKVSKNGI